MSETSEPMRDPAEFPFVDGVYFIEADGNRRFWARYDRSWDMMFDPFGAPVMGGEMTGWSESWKAG